MSLSQALNQFAQNLGRYPESPVICDPDMAPVRLDRARTTMEKTNDRIRTRVKSLRDTIDKAKFKKTDQYA